MSDKYPGLPDIQPDPRIQLETWQPAGLTAAERTYYVQVRRAFIQALVARHPITSMDEMREAIRRRFGAPIGTKVLGADFKELGIIRVPMPGGGQRLKLASQLADANIEDEFDERVRIDVLGMKREGTYVYLEVNRGTAQAVIQLLNLLIDDGLLPYVLGIASDHDKWIILHFTDGNRSRQFQTWMRPKLF